MQSTGGTPALSSKPYLPANALADRAKLLRHISSLSEENTRLQLQLNGGAGGGNVGSTAAGGGGPAEMEVQLIAKQSEIERLVQHLAEGGLLQESLRKRTAELQEECSYMRTQRNEVIEVNKTMQDHSAGQRFFVEYLALIFDPERADDELESMRQRLEVQHDGAIDLPQEDPHRVSCALQQHCLERLDAVFRNQDSFEHLAKENEEQLREDLRILKSQGPTVQVVSSDTTKEALRSQLALTDLLLPTATSSSPSSATATSLSFFERRQQELVSFVDTHATMMMQFVSGWYKIEWQRAETSRVLSESSEIRSQAAAAGGSFHPSSRSHNTSTSSNNIYNSNSVYHRGEKPPAGMVTTPHLTQTTTVNEEERDEEEEGERRRRNQSQESQRRHEEEEAVLKKRCQELEELLLSEQHNTEVSRRETREAQKEIAYQSSRVDKIKAYESTLLEDWEKAMAETRDNVFKELEPQIRHAYEMGRRDGISDSDHSAVRKGNTTTTTTAAASTTASTINDHHHSNNHNHTSSITTAGGSCTMNGNVSGDVVSSSSSSPYRQPSSGVPLVQHNVSPPASRSTMMQEPNFLQVSPGSLGEEDGNENGRSVTASTKRQGDSVKHEPVMLPLQSGDGKSDSGLPPLPNDGKEHVVINSQQKTHLTTMSSSTSRTRSSSHKKMNLVTSTATCTPVAFSASPPPSGSCSDSSGEEAVTGDVIISRKGERASPSSCVPPGVAPPGGWNSRSAGGKSRGAVKKKRSSSALSPNPEEVLGDGGHGKDSYFSSSSTDASTLLEEFGKAKKGRYIHKRPAATKSGDGATAGGGSWTTRGGGPHQQSHDDPTKSTSGGDGAKTSSYYSADVGTTGGEDDDEMSARDEGMVASAGGACGGATAGTEHRQGKREHHVGFSAHSSFSHELPYVPHSMRTHVSSGYEEVDSPGGVGAQRTEGGPRHVYQQSIPAPPRFSVSSSTSTASTGFATRSQLRGSREGGDGDGSSHQAASGSESEGSLSTLASVSTIPNQSD